MLINSSVIVCRGAIFVLNEKLLTSYLMLESSFIWFCLFRSSNFPYYRAILFRRYRTWLYRPIESHLNQCFIVFLLQKVMVTKWRYSDFWKLFFGGCGSWAPPDCLVWSLTSVVAKLKIEGKLKEFFATHEI